MSARRGLRELSYPPEIDPARLLIVHCLNTLSNPPRAERILIVRLGAMGDVVRTLPSLQAIRLGYPAARISWLVERSSAGVLTELEDLDDVLIFPRESLSTSLRAGRLLRLWAEIRDFVASLRREKFDLVLDFHSILKSGVLSYLSGASCRVALAPPLGREGGWVFANHRVRLPPRRMSRYDRNAGIVHYLGILDPNSERRPSQKILTAPQHAAARMDECLAGMPAWILIHPGSSARTPYKRYKPEGYAALAGKLLAEHGIPSLVTRGASAAELALAERVVADAGGAASLAPETPQIADLIALIARAQLLVGGDSGPLHIAASLGVPVVQILGATDPVENHPLEATRSSQVRVPVSCSPCRRGCPAATCMQIISHEAVFEAAAEILASMRDCHAARAPRPESPRPASARVESGCR